MDYLLDFHRKVVNTFESRHKRKDEPMVGSLIEDHSPTFEFSTWYFNPYLEWENLVMLPALIWASIFAIANGPWETIMYIFETGLFQENFTDYVWM
jgi:hypothetical protein